MNLFLSLLLSLGFPLTSLDAGRTMWWDVCLTAGGERESLCLFHSLIHVLETHTQDTLCAVDEREGKRGREMLVGWGSGHTKHTSLSQHPLTRSPRGAVFLLVTKISFRFTLTFSLRANGLESKQNLVSEKRGRKREMKRDIKKQNTSCVFCVRLKVLFVIKWVRRREKFDVWIQWRKKLKWEGETFLREEWKEKDKLQEHSLSSGDERRTKITSPNW